MLEISEFFSKLGFKMNIHDDGAFHCSYELKSGLTLYVIFIDSIIGINAQHNGLNRTIVDNSKIDCVNDILFILLRSIYIKTTVKCLYRKITQYHI
jgi:hypothetical protein